MGKIYAAKTNHITNPVGFYMEQIVFSWKVKECEGKKQKNARILLVKRKTFQKSSLIQRKQNLTAVEQK